MKNWIRLGILAVVLGSSANLWARDWPADNPDRYPSIGLSYLGLFQTGDLSFMTGTGTTSQDIDNTDNRIFADVRFPMTDSVTLTGGVGYAAAQATADETSTLSGQDQDLSGFLVGVGVRFYMR
jgi:hypothetical protein